MKIIKMLNFYNHHDQDQHSVTIHMMIILFTVHSFFIIIKTIFIVIITSYNYRIWSSRPLSMLSSLFSLPLTVNILTTMRKAPVAFNTLLAFGHIWIPPPSKIRISTSLSGQNSWIIADISVLHLMTQTQSRLSFSIQKYNGLPSDITKWKWRPFPTPQSVQRPTISDPVVTPVIRNDRCHHCPETVSNDDGSSDVISSDDVSTDDDGTSYKSPRKEEGKQINPKINWDRYPKTVGWRGGMADGELEKGGRRNVF